MSPTFGLRQFDVQASAGAPLVFPGAAPDECGSFPIGDRLCRTVQHRKWQSRNVRLILIVMLDLMLILILLDTGSKHTNTDTY